MPAHKKKKDIAAEFGIPCSTLSTILQEQGNSEETTCSWQLKKFRLKESTKPDVDAALFQWFTAARAQSVPLSGEILKAKAEELNSGMGHDQWSCSSGWLSRWKVRHNIRYRRVCGENAAVDKDVCEEWTETVLLPVLRRYDPCDVFNADETGLYWRLLPDKTHAVSGETCTGGKMSKERVTILVCANMSGSEKLPLLAIGKFKKPRCFRGVTCLPVEYEANRNAWMTAAIFEEWLRKWDEKLGRRGRKIALFVDYCSAHPHISSLNFIELIFLPPNTTSEIQPCDQGIIKTFKTYYRKSMVTALLHAIGNGSTILNFKISLLDGLQMAKKSWDSVTTAAISNCFRKAGFVLPAEQEVDEIEQEVDEMAPEEETEDTILEPLEINCTFEEYVCSDNNLQCTPMLSSADIVATLGSVEDNDSDDAGDELPVIT